MKVGVEMTRSVDPLVQSRRSAHDQATRGQWAEVVSTLSEHLGNAVVAGMAGVTAETVSRWSNPARRSAPKPESERRLRDAYAIFQDLTRVDSAHTVRAWFLGSNPYLGEASPAERILEDDFKSVLAAARAFRDLG